MQAETEQGNSKFKLILGIAVVLVGLLFTANWIVGNIIANRLAENLDNNFQEIKAIESFDYENIKVNPMLAQVTITDGHIRRKIKFNPSGLIDFNSDKLVYQGSYADLANLMNEQSNTIKELHKLKADFDNLEISGTVFGGANKFDFVFSFAELGLDFKGDLSFEQLENNPEELLTANQKLQFTAYDFEMNFPELFDKILINSNLQEKLMNLKKIDLTLDYTADNKVIEVKETVDSDHSSGELVGNIKLLGTDVSNITGMKLDLESDGQFEVTNLKWGKADKTGQYTIAKLSGKSEFEVDRKVQFSDYVEKENMILGESDYEINLEGLKAQFAGTLKEKLSSNPLVMMSGINISQIVVNNFNLVYQTNNRQVRIEKGKLNSSLVDADFQADLNMNNQYPGLSEINNCKVKLSDFKGNLRRLFEGMESRMGASLPREGDAIVLEMKGTFDQPQIRGIHY